jgi:P-type conjugative transfer protein TrbG
MIPFVLLSSAGAFALGLALPVGDQALPPPPTKGRGLHPTREPGSPSRAPVSDPSAPAFINATAVFAWNDNVVYHAFAAPGRVTDIVLQPGEQLGSVASGDTARWTIGDTTSGSGPDKRAHILVKPFSVGLTTNIVITTDRRTYHLLLTAGAGNAMSAISWTYAADEMIAVRKAEEARFAATPVAGGLDIDALNFGYTVSGDRPAWRPLRVFDDGRQTFVEFPSTLGTGEAPPLFAIGTTGDAELVNYRVRGHFYIVDRLLDRAELRLGTKKALVVRITRDSSSGKRGGRK